MSSEVTWKNIQTVLVAAQFGNKPETKVLTTQEASYRLKAQTCENRLNILKPTARNSFQNWGSAKLTHLGCCHCTSFFNIIF
jgi:hypothetical protein